MSSLQYPSYDPALRIAVLTPDLKLAQIQRLIARSRAVAGTPGLLRRLAEAVEAGAIELPVIDAAVIVLTGIAHGEVTVLERDLFWRVFQVPVFEQYLAPDGLILAMECDAHEGLHLLDSRTLLPGICAVMNANPCGCGNSHPRISAFARQMPDLPAPPVRPAVAA